MLPVFFEFSRVASVLLFFVRQQKKGKRPLLDAVPPFLFVAMRSRLLLARILSDEQDCSRLCLRDDIDEGMVGMEIDTTRLVGGEG